MIMQMVILGVGVPDMGGIRGLPGITGTDDGGCRLDFRGDRLRNRFTRALGEGQEPESASGEARGRGGLGSNVTLSVALTRRLIIRAVAV